MSNAELSFDSKEWDRLLKKLRTKWSDIKKRKEFGGIISASVFRDVIDHFDKESGPDGKWQKWSETYDDHMKKIGRGGNKILQFSGKLRQSFKPTSWKEDQDGILFFNDAVTKSGYPYAAGHDAGDGKLPKRSFMWLSRAAMTNIINQTEKWLSEDL